MNEGVNTDTRVSFAVHFPTFTHGVRVENVEKGNSTVASRIPRPEATSSWASVLA